MGQAIEREIATTIDVWGIAIGFWFEFSMAADHTAMGLAALIPYTGFELDVLPCLIADNGFMPCFVPL